ncbi:MAG: non-hydrolyzing UDP-N-acetylglucosamine 2-epimerase [Candidatus Hodarchaeota archaeon]
MSIAFIVGTRPEIIKMSPIIRKCQEKGEDFFIIHTGQHYSFKLDGIFFKELDLPLPQHNLEIGSGSHAEITGKCLIGTERVLKDTKPRIVLVEGDTNSVLAGALSAAKLHIPIGHVEAGLRSYDRNMPEEINRILTDHLSDLLFAPTKTSRQNLLKEGIEDNKIYVTGNSIVDAVTQNVKIAIKKKNTLKDLNLISKQYILLTLHRQENVDDIKRLKNIFVGLEKVYQKYGTPIIYPIHPRTEKRIKEFNLKLSEGMQIIQPVSFLEFLLLESNALLILTDSGGVQEEACILKIPCVTLRDNTERPETIETGANILAGTNPIRILNSVKKMANTKTDWDNPLGDGKAGERILAIIKSKY